MGIWSPGADTVGLAKIGEGESFELTKEGESRFLSSINTLWQEGYIILFVQGEEEDDVKQLIRYQAGLQRCVHFHRMQNCCDE